MALSLMLCKNSKERRHLAAIKLETGFGCRIVFPSNHYKGFLLVHKCSCQSPQIRNPSNSDHPLESSICLHKTDPGRWAVLDKGFGPLDNSGRMTDPHPPHRNNRVSHHKPIRLECVGRDKEERLGERILVVSFDHPIEVWNYLRRA